MAALTQIGKRQRLQLGLMLTFLLGVCSLTSPHLLSHGHAHAHRGAGQGSTNNSTRARTGSLGAEAEADSVQVHLKVAPYSPSGDGVHALLAATGLQFAEFTSHTLPTADDAFPARSLPGTQRAGRAPPAC